MKIVLAVFCVVSLWGCSEYSKILKSTDPEAKLEAALNYYNEGECYKALPLLEELIGTTRGTQRAEEVYFYYAKTHYCIRDFYLANYYFKNFHKTYGQSKYAEEALFLAAMSSKENSPGFELDQGDTRTAINEFQLFLDNYPTSVKKDTSNYFIGELRSKLERKSFEVAKLYVKTEKYKSAVSALDYAMAEFSDSRYREEMEFLALEASFEYANRSYDNKKEERFADTMERFINFADSYGKDSKWFDRAERYFERARDYIEQQ